MIQAVTKDRRQLHRKLKTIYVALKSNETANMSACFLQWIN